MLNENGVVPSQTTRVNESKSMEYTSLTDKVDKLLESIQKTKIDSAQNNLDEAGKQKVSDALNEAKQVNVISGGR